MRPGGGSSFLLSGLGLTLWLSAWCGLARACGGLGARVPAPPVELAMDVDGDGNLDVVRVTRGADSYWADVWIGGQLKSTTPILDGQEGAALELAATDIHADGRSHLILSCDRNGHGWARVSLAPGRGFQPPR